MREAVSGPGARAQEEQVPAPYSNSRQRERRTDARRDPGKPPAGADEGGFPKSRLEGKSGIHEMVPGCAGAEPCGGSNLHG